MSIDAKGYLYSLVYSSFDDVFCVMFSENIYFELTSQFKPHNVSPYAKPYSAYSLTNKITYMAGPMWFIQIWYNNLQR